MVRVTSRRTVGAESESFPPLPRALCQLTGPVRPNYSTGADVFHRLLKRGFDFIRIGIWV